MKLGQYLRSPLIEKTNSKRISVGVDARIKRPLDQTIEFVHITQHLLLNKGR